MVSLDRFLSTAHLSMRALLQPTVIGVRAFVENREGQVALVRHSYRSGWFLPGGGVGRGEPPEAAAVREAREEVGLSASATPELFGLYSGRVGLVSHVVAIYRLRDAELTFRKSLEVRELLWADPAEPPPRTSSGTLRRLAEFSGKAAKSKVW